MSYHKLFRDRTEWNISLPEAYIDYYDYLWFLIKAIIVVLKNRIQFKIKHKILCNLFCPPTKPLYEWYHGRFTVFNEEFWGWVEFRKSLFMISYLKLDNFKVIMGRENKKVPKEYLNLYFIATRKYNHQGS